MKHICISQVLLNSTLLSHCIDWKMSLLQFRESNPSKRLVQLGSTPCTIMKYFKIRIQNFQSFASKYQASKFSLLGKIISEKGAAQIQTQYKYKYTQIQIHINTNTNTQQNNLTERSCSVGSNKKSWGQRTTGKTQNENGKNYIFSKSILFALILQRKYTIIAMIMMTWRRQ